jgi:hypothetical protein
MQRYLRLWAFTTLALIVFVAAINAVVDPYGMFRWVDVPGFNEAKPKSGLHGSTVKPYEVLRIRPRAVAFGNSRVEVGLDPNSAAWPASARPVFNFALPGTGPSTTRSTVEHVLAAADDGLIPKPTVIVWGIDFPDFLDDPHGAPRTPQQRRGDPRLLANPDGSRNGTARTLQALRDYGEATLTLGALVDSAITVAHRHDPDAAGITRQGFNPLAEYRRVTADIGYRGVFDQKDVSDTAAYFRRSTSVFDASGNSSPDLEDMRAILDLCRSHGVALKLLIYPIHAHLLEAIRTTGHWPVFETWRRTVVRIVADEAHAAHGAPFPLWDFSGFNRYSMEPIPAPGDHRTSMQWYWEGGHYKKELGDLMLARMFDIPGAPQDFGVLLDSTNVEGVIAAMRAGDEDYRARFPDEVARMERLAQRLAPPGRR